MSAEEDDSMAVEGTDRESLDSEGFRTLMAGVTYKEVTAGTGYYSLLFFHRLGPLKGRKPSTSKP